MPSEKNVQVKITDGNKKRTKEEREQEFIEAAEQINGFPFLPWQRDLVLQALRETNSGRRIDLGSMKKAISGRLRSY